MKYFEEALLFNRETGYRAGEAAALNNMGLVYYDIGNTKEALKYFEEALPLRYELGDRAGEAKTLNSMGLVYNTIGDLQEALRLYEEALFINREVGDRAQETVSSNGIASIYHNLGRIQEALKWYEQALSISQEIGNRAEEATALNNIASVYHDIGRIQEALKWYEQALSINQEIGNRAEEATALNNIAMVYSDTGQTQDALKLCEEALLIQREVGDRSGEATTLNNIALVYSDAGRPLEALKLCEEALLIRREVGDRAGEIAGLVNLALLLYRHFDQSADAITFLEQALQIFVTTGLPQDASGRTVEQVRQFLIRIQDEMKSIASSTLPFEAVQWIITTTIAVMTIANSDRLKWHERITSALQEAQQRGADRQQECDFYTAVLSILDGQSPTLPSDNPYTQAIEAIQKGIIADEPVQMDASDAMMQAIREFLNAEDWEAARRVLEAQYALLFQAEAEVIFEHNIEQAKAEKEERTAQILELYLALLRECKKHGIAEAFEHLLSMMHSEEEPPPFAPELIPGSIHALNGGPQEKMAYVQYLAALSTETTNEQLKALINVIQLALFGGDPSQLGQHLEDVYRQAWETILAGLTTSGGETV